MHRSRKISIPSLSQTSRRTENRNADNSMLFYYHASQHAMWCTWIAARTSFPLPFLPFPLPFSSFFGLTTAGACGFFFFFSTTATSFWKNEQAKGKASNECLSVPKTKNHKGRWHLEFGLHGFELFISSSITHVHVPQNSAFFVARLTPKNIDRGFDLNTGVSYNTPMPIDRVIENKSIHPS